MAQESTSKPTNDEFCGNEIVISGVSTITPGCSDLTEFAKKLYNKENFVKPDNSRWETLKHPELSPYLGKITKYSCFDAQYFKINYGLAYKMDVVMKVLMEQSFQAIFDAGICPNELWGKQIGVFIGTALCEIETMAFYSKLPSGLLGCNNAMYSNRISYYLNLKGPSVTINGSCSGSVIALQKAIHAMKTGQCEAAIVGASKLVLLPTTPILYSRTIPLSPDGKVRSYDESANGQALSEATVVIYLQKYKDAKRMYATVCHGKTEFGGLCRTKNGPKYGPYRDLDKLIAFLREFYDEAGVSPSQVEYVEGFGAAIPEVDKTELEAIDEIFCEKRSKPILVGSIMSNIGYTEAASGLCGVVKLLLAYQSGQIAANLNCSNPRRDVAALRDGRMEIVNEHRDFNRTYAAVNSFSVTGINGHILLKGCSKPKDISRYHCNLPYLVLVSGRQESAVGKILDDIKSHTIDPEEIALLHNIFRIHISRHLARGFGIYTSEDEKTVAIGEEIQYYDETKRPLWFVYSGMGSQWTGMGIGLMRIPIFAAAIERCHKALTSKGIDLTNIITSSDPTIFDNILNSFVGIAAIQIGLTDVLKAIGLVPDNIIGHSVGELGCAYADGCFTAEEMILMAYYRGLVSVQTPFIRGSMAAVGIGYKQILKICPPEIEIACRNSRDSCTISGPAEKVGEFVATLTSQKVFAKEVNCSNIPYHTRYIAEAGPLLLKATSQVIESPKLRSQKWLSTSVPETKWSESDAKYCSAEYFTNNLLNPVLFEEMLHHVPSNAVLVEIAPHGLLQAILKRSLPATCQNYSLTRRNSPDSVKTLLEVIGRIYIEGYEVDVSVLYPKIEFPVSVTTRSFSHMIEWSHDEKWTLFKYVYPERNHTTIYKQIISLHDDDHSYLTGHSIQGTMSYPFAAALISVWDTLAMRLNVKRKSIPVMFENITCYNQPHLYEHRTLQVTVALQKGSGRFEVTHGHGHQNVIADGFIKVVQKSFRYTNDENVQMDLTNEDVYKLLCERGYDYRDQFRSIHSANISMTHAKLIWNDNWVTLLDGMLQFDTLRRSTDNVTQINHIMRITINVKEHTTESTYSNENVMFNAQFDDVANSVRCGGVSIVNIMSKTIPAVVRRAIAFKKLKFVPYIQNENYDINSTLYVYLQIIAENCNKENIKIVYINNSNSNENCVLNQMKDLLNSPPVLALDIIHLKWKDSVISEIMREKPDVVFIDKFLSDKKIYETLSRLLPPNTFVVNVGADTEGMYPSSVYSVICSAGKGDTTVELLRWRPQSINSSTTAFTIKSVSDLNRLKLAMHNVKDHQKLLVLMPYPCPFEIKDLIKKWRKNETRGYISVVMFNQKNSNEEYAWGILNHNLVYSVINNNTWGGEYYLPTNSDSAPARNVTLTCTHIGDLDSLRWVEVVDASVEGVLVNVHYAGLNINDAKRAMGKTEDKTGYGMDFSGVTETGERVMGLTYTSSASTKIYVKPTLLWPVPKHWSLEDAATVPLAYAHAFYCFAIKSKLCPGNTVLIHGGAGGLGQAAISIALAFQCEVFTTVSDIHKKLFLMKMFPDLKEDHIGNSRDSVFGDMVMSLTHKNGCNIVINCLQGQLKNISLNCCMRTCYTIDTTPLSNQEKYDFGMYNLNLDRTYNISDFSSILAFENYEELALLQSLVSEGISCGYVRPLSRVTYAAREAARALRLLAASRHRGRVLLRLPTGPASAPEILEHCRMSCDQDYYHVIICNEEHLGVQLANKLVVNGAKKIYLNILQPSGYLHYKMQSLVKLGAQVKVSSKNLGSNIIAKMFEECDQCEVEAIYVVTTGLQDEKSRAEMDAALTSLDSESRKLCLQLRYFTVISDSAIGRDVVLDRSQNGFPSLLIQLHVTQQFNMLENSAVTINPRIAWSELFNTIEKNLFSEDLIVEIAAHTLPLHRTLEEIALITGIDMKNPALDELTLEHVGVDSDQAKTLSNLLSNAFNISVCEESVLNMKVGDLKELKEKYIDIREDVAGFGALYTSIGSEELFSTTEIVTMRTLPQSTERRSDEIEKGLSYLCIVPGLEGHYCRFEQLCKRLRVPAVVLQPGTDNPNDTIPEIAQRLVNVIVAKLKPKEHFYLVGYEFGVLIVLEMAQMLESLGFSGTVYLLGGTPADIRDSIELRLSNIGDAWEDALALHMYTLLAGTESADLKNELKMKETWPQKLSAWLTELRSKVTLSSQNMLNQIETAHSRLTILREYTTNIERLRSKVVILKAKTPNLMRAEHYSRLSEQEVLIYNLEATLAYAPLDLRCAAIINKCLEPDIIEEFANSNQCETAMLSGNKDKFVDI